MYGDTKNKKDRVGKKGIVSKIAEKMKSKKIDKPAKGSDLKSPQTDKNN
jgi:hypothetical protein